MSKINQYMRIAIFKNTSLFVLLLLGNQLIAQTVESANADTSKPVKVEEKKTNTLNISADMRVRTEYRHGYRNLAYQDTSAAFFVQQRTRINFDYKAKKFDFYVSLQDSRIWGQQDPRAGHGTTSGVTDVPNSTTSPYFFEAYAEPHLTDRWSIRIGRQRVMYDNQRLFAENDWRMAANAHDAIRFIYNDKVKVNTELVAAFNQSAENNFTTNYVPAGFKNYKVLINHYLNWKISKNLTLTTLNTADGYQSSEPKKYNSTYMRYTNGGRLEYSSYNWYVTFSGYYQHGFDSTAKEISAFYFQPEIKYSGIKNLTIRLGAEYLSGQDSTSTKNTGFVPLYGVAHRFMGNMDFFTQFPTDVNNGGLLNPYLFFQYQTTKWSVRMENHLFYSHTLVPFKGKPDNNKYLGFENDWRINYKPNSFTDIELGACWASVTNSMVEVRNPKIANADIPNYSKSPYWTYLSVKFTPSLAKLSF